MKDLLPIICLLAFMVLAPRAGWIFGGLLRALGWVNGLLQMSRKTRVENKPLQKPEFHYGRSQPSNTHKREQPLA